MKIKSILFSKSSPRNSLLNYKLQLWLSDSRSNGNLEILVIVKGGKQEKSREKPSEHGQEPTCVWCAGLGFKLQLSHPCSQKTGSLKDSQWLIDWLQNTAGLAQSSTKGKEITYSIDMLCPSFGSKHGQYPSTTAHVKNNFVTKQMPVVVHCIAICCCAYFILDHFLLYNNKALLILFMCQLHVHVLWETSVMSKWHKALNKDWFYSKYVSVLVPHCSGVGSKTRGINGLIATGVLCISNIYFAFQ